MKYHLRYWSKASGMSSNPLIPANQTVRIYVNGEDGSTLGYVERRMVEVERGRSSYYDRHRRAKGDTSVSAIDEATNHLPTGILPKILAAIATIEPQYKRGFGDDLSEFFALQAFARGRKGFGPAAKHQRRRADAFTVEL